MKYRKKPVIIEAFKYDGDFKYSTGTWYIPQWALNAYRDGILYYEKLNNNEPPSELFIKTLEGNMHVSVGDYVVKGIDGELYPCKPDIFEKTYEPLEKINDSSNS